MSPLLAFIIICFSCNTPHPKKAEQDVEWTAEDRKIVINGLNRTTEELKKEIEHLTEEQANFKEDETKWSIKDIVEHLEMQNQLHFRELKVISNTPQLTEYAYITTGKDDYFSNYSTNPKTSKAQWFLQPRNRYDSMQNCWQAFYEARNELFLLVASSDIDFRRHFTFRVPASTTAIQDLKIGQVRDLHQLVLTGIAHTDRHLTQIRGIKSNPGFPR